MSEEVKDQARELITQFKTIITTLCADPVEIAPQINGKMLTIEARCSAPDTATLIGKSGKTKFSILHLIEAKARKINFQPRIDIWVQEKKDA